MAATARQAGAPKRAATKAPIAAPIGLAPKVAVMISAETRPSIACGVTAWRSVMVVIDHRIGPAPNRKKLSPASRTVGNHRVRSMTRAAQKPPSGPITIIAPKGRRRDKAGAIQAPATMPAP
ncbi:hypothetical protein BTHI11S_03247 [Bosea thiooxidans]